MVHIDDRRKRRRADFDGMHHRGDSLRRGSSFVTPGRAQVKRPPRVDVHLSARSGRCGIALSEGILGPNDQEDSGDLPPQHGLGHRRPRSVRQECPESVSNPPESRHDAALRFRGPGTVAPGGSAQWTVVAHTVQREPSGTSPPRPIGTNSESERGFGCERRPSHGTRAGRRHRDLPTSVQ